MFSDSNTIEASDIFTIVGNLASKTENLITIVAVLAVMGAILLTYWKSKALVPTVVAMLIGGFVLWALANTGWFSSTAGTTITNNSAPPTAHVLVIQHDPDRSV